MNYEKFLREHHLKVTPQRLGILSLMHNAGHISVDDLYVRIKKQFSSISLATLYKNINAMLDSRIITEVKIPNAKQKYEIVKAPHIHLLCQKCKEFLDLELNLEGLINEASQQSHYEIEESNIILSGLCKRCQED